MTRTKGSDAEETRARIIRVAADLFNQHGYEGVSISDLMRETGLEKGGIYNHFPGKEAIAEAAFLFAVDTCRAPILAAVEAAHTPAGKLRAFVGAFIGLVESPPLPGGCPVMNTAIEFDDGNVHMRDLARTAMNARRSVIRMLLERGVAGGEFDASLDLDAEADLVLSSLQGAIMLSKLAKDSTPMRHTVGSLLAYINTRIEI